MLVQSISFDSMSDLFTVNKVVRVRFVFALCFIFIEQQSTLLNDTNSNSIGGCDTELLKNTPPLSFKWAIVVRDVAEPVDCLKKSSNS